jgi:hypothetical protein
MINGTSLEGKWKNSGVDLKGLSMIVESDVQVNLADNPEFLVPPSLPFFAYQ